MVDFNTRNAQGNFRQSVKQDSLEQTMKKSTNVYEISDSRLFITTARL